MAERRRRTFAQVEAAAIVAERSALLAFAREHRAQVRALVAAGKLTADDASIVTRRVFAFAGGVAQGLHVAGDAVAVRHAMRDVVIADAAERSSTRV